MDKRNIIDFGKSIGKTLAIGIVLLLSAIFVLFILGYTLQVKSIDPSIFLIASITGWCTICFKLWSDYMRGKNKKEKIISAVIYLVLLTWFGIGVISIVSPQPILNIYLMKAFFSWYFGLIIGILYEVIRPKKTRAVID